MYNGKFENINTARIHADENNNRIWTYQIDISDYEKMYTIFDIYKPNFVFHQASMLTLDSQKYRYQSIQSGVVGSVNIFELSLLHSVEKVVLASSASVYGNPDTFPTKEYHLFNNKLLYGANKIAVEYLAKSYADNDGLKFISFRPFNVTSPRQSNKNVYVQIVPKFINAFIDGKDITIYGNGTQTMDIIHAEDIARLNILAAQSNYHRNNPNSFYGFINACSGIETSVLQLIEYIKKWLKIYKIEYNKSKITFEEHDPNLVRRRLGDTTLLHSMFGIHSKNVDDIIKECVNSILVQRGLT